MVGKRLTCPESTAGQPSKPAIKSAIDFARRSLFKIPRECVPNDWTRLAVAGD